ncbi:MAG TPA: universal stress protein [Gemmataceae bacterium]|nr:universal stress protein [Gemmataceae bacterium]
MHPFHNILAGVDLIQGKQIGVATMDAVADHAVRQAIWLASQSGARLTMLSVLGAHDRIGEREARLALAQLAEQARAQGIDPRIVVTCGDSSAEIIRQVQREQYDLVLVGTRERRAWSRLLSGSTSRKLLHRCPCPVWISKPGRQTAPQQILVASDLSPLSEAVVQMGLEIGQADVARVHILDVVEFPLDQLWSPSPADPVTERYHVQLRGEALQALQQQVARNEDGPPEPAVSIHVADSDGLADHAVVKFTREHDIDLLVLGSVGRHGFSGMMLGNMAERLLPQVRCSLLAVKREPLEH